MNRDSEESSCYPRTQVGYDEENLYQPLLSTHSARSATGGENPDGPPSGVGIHTPLEEYDRCGMKITPLHRRLLSTHLRRVRRGSRKKLSHTKVAILALRAECDVLGDVDLGCCYPRTPCGMRYAEDRPSLILLSPRPCGARTWMPR